MDLHSRKSSINGEINKVIIVKYSLDFSSKKFEKKSSGDKELIEILNECNECIEKGM